MYLRIRITPAGAGKTSCWSRSAASTWDHPRRCGENEPAPEWGGFTEGSPPQVRGKQAVAVVAVAVVGITPAGAGKTAAETPSMRCTNGSPPQVRGKPEAVAKLRRYTGITPAGAGKTAPHSPARVIAWDHPRRCGENRKVVARKPQRKGSPPQVRGKPCCADRVAEGERITPAGAGKTIGLSVRMLITLDHPRRCGENDVSSGENLQAMGSPPQMRGKHASGSRTAADLGITPADAGKTLKRSFRNQPFCSRAVQISFNFSNSLNVSLQSGSAR